MWSISSSPPIVCGWILFVAACTTQPSPDYPRPPLPLPEVVAERYRIPDSIREELLVPIGRQENIDLFRGRIGAGSDHVDFHFLIPDSDKPRPFILLLPILAGGESLMWIVGWNLAKRGYSVAWTRRAGKALTPGQRAPEMEELLRRTVVQNRLLLEWVRQEGSVDPAAMALVGISMGGMLGGVLLALEPDLAAGALCLAGGDLPDLIMNSVERRVRRWRDWRFREDGIAGHELRRELNTYLVSDPASFGAYVSTDRVFLVGALLDEVIPISNQDLLWESFGRPRRLSLPFGHYTAAIGIDSILNDVAGFINERFELRAASPPRQPPPDIEPPPDIQ
jgi:pimeloyl-ACP methyl ester carboxylesterase